MLQTIRNAVLLVTLVTLTYAAGVSAEEFEDDCLQEGGTYAESMWVSGIGWLCDHGPICFFLDNPCTSYFCEEGDEGMGVFCQS